MEPKFSPEKSKEDKWERAILLERERPPHPTMIDSLTEVLDKDSALILGDACKVNSKFLIEQAGFQSVDNVDQSPLINDDYYISDKLHNHQVLFGDFDFPENKYDFIYGKSISFLKPKILEKILIKIKESLKPGGIFTSIWLLPKTTVASHGIWEKETIEKALEKTNFSTVSQKEVFNDIGSLSGKEGVTHYMELILRKSH